MYLFIQQNNSVSVSFQFLLQKNSSCAVESPLLIILFASIIYPYKTHVALESHNNLPLLSNNVGTLKCFNKLSSYDNNYGTLKCLN